MGNDDLESHTIPPIPETGTNVTHDTELPQLEGATNHPPSVPGEIVPVESPSLVETVPTYPPSPNTHGHTRLPRLRRRPTFLKDYVVDF